jgi:hypothetical protein
MKKLKSVLCALALIVAFSIPALAGEIPIGGFCNSAECVSESQPVDGGVWIQIGENLWIVGGMY